LTICIAALCAEGDACVVAADRQITGGFPLNVEFEHHERKIDEVSASCVVLSSGNALIGAEVVSKARSKLNPSGTSVRAVAELVRDFYTQNHLQRAEQAILIPRGWTLTEYKDHGSTKIPAQVYINIDQQFWQFGLGVADFLVAGVDDDGSHIGYVHYHGIQSPGWLDWYDKLGYHAIGTGQTHAAVLLALTGQHKDLPSAQTIYNVYCAKKAAEVAPGVGSETDLAVLTMGKISYVDGVTLDKLKKYRERSEKKDSDSKELVAIYEAWAKPASG
jgi:hypothetical protein